MYRRIFIGGTGRSGTTILYRALGCHENIYALPKEMRFVTEPDGVMDLVDALSTRYTINKSREALYKFERLMRFYMADPEGEFYPNYDMPNWIGADYYERRLKQFCEELVDFSFNGISAPLRPPLDASKTAVWKKQLKKLGKTGRGKDKQIRQFKFPHRDIRVVKYFSNRYEILDLSAKFVDDLFMHVAEKEGKQTWCEKTPNTLQSLDFVWEMFPTAVFIHMVRDPRGVLASMRKVRWAPDNTRDLCLFLQKIYDRWFDLKAKLDFSQYKYLEVKLEKLAADPKSTLTHISQFCGLPNSYHDLPEISVEQVNSWQSRMSHEDLQIANKLLGPYIVQLGYTI
ncbi:MAG: sulfotransferase [Chloroflexi bacterium]|nr:sulfotransferase [Chloroflexota bacterium]